MQKGQAGRDEWQPRVKGSTSTSRGYHSAILRMEAVAVDRCMGRPCLESKEAVCKVKSHSKEATVLKTCDQNNARGSHPSLKMRGALRRVNWLGI